MIEIPAYLLPRPAFALDATTRARCDALLAECLRDPGIDLTQRLAIPPWQFCCYLTDTQPVLLHGSKNPAITAFVPRRSFDHNPFGDRRAVFAASDGIWPLFFALVERERYHLSLVNGCLRLVAPDGQRSDPYYFFSISQTALPHDPWSSGTIYILPRQTFAQHPPRTMSGWTVEPQEWASLEPVHPIAFLRVEPDDFPLRAEVRGHDDLTLQRRATANPDGWPWLDER